MVERSDDRKDEGNKREKDRSRHVPFFFFLWEMLKWLELCGVWSGLDYSSLIDFLLVWLIDVMLSSERTLIWDWSDTLSPPPLWLLKRHFYIVSAERCRLKGYQRIWVIVPIWNIIKKLNRKDETKWKTASAWWINSWMCVECWHRLLKRFTLVLGSVFPLFTLRTPITPSLI